MNNINIQTFKQAITPFFAENTLGISPTATLGVMAAANAVFLFMVDSTIKHHFIDQTKPRTYTKLILTESLFAGSCATLNYLLAKVLKVQLGLIPLAIITATAVSFHLLLNRFCGTQKAKAVDTPKKPTAEVQRLNTELSKAKKAITDLEGKLATTQQEKRKLDETLHDKTDVIGRKEQEINDLQGERERLAAAHTSLLETSRKLETSLQQAEANKK